MPKTWLSGIGSGRALQTTKYPPALVGLAGPKAFVAAGPEMIECLSAAAGACASLLLGCPPQAARSEQAAAAAEKSSPADAGLRVCEVIGVSVRGWEKGPKRSGRARDSCLLSMWSTFTYFPGKTAF